MNLFFCSNLPSDLLSFILRSLTAKSGSLLGSQCEVSNPVPLALPLSTGQWSSESSWELRKPLALVFFNPVRNLGTIKTPRAFPLTSKGASSGTEASLQIDTWGALRQKLPLVFHSGENCLFHFTQIRLKTLPKEFTLLLFCVVVGIFCMCKSPLCLTSPSRVCKILWELGNSLLRQAGRWLCGPHAAGLTGWMNNICRAPSPLSGLLYEVEHFHPHWKKAPFNWDGFKGGVCKILWFRCAVTVRVLLAPFQTPLKPNSLIPLSWKIPFFPCFFSFLFCLTEAAWEATWE